MIPNASILPKLSQAHLSLLARCGVTRAYQKNSVLVFEGDQGDCLYIILSGKIKIFVSDSDGKEVLLNTLGPGDYFGELALIDSEPRSASAMTLETSQIAVVSRADFQCCLAEHPELALELIRALVKRVRALTENVKDLALLDVYGRVARTLLSLATEQGDHLVIEQRLTHQDIANRIGATREMVGRILKDLSVGGYIDVEDRKIIIRKKLPPRW